MTEVEVEHLAPNDWRVRYVVPEGESPWRWAHDWNAVMAIVAAMVGRSVSEVERELVPLHCYAVLGG